MNEMHHPGVEAESDAVRQARVELACAFRWAHRYNWHEGVANHFSLSISDDGRKFLINPFLRHFSRIRASELIVVDADDPDTLNRPDAPEATAFGLHGGVHRHRPEARCALHVHSKYATVLACLADPTMTPIDQNTARFFNRVAYDAGYGGMAFGDEGARCAQMLTDGKHVLLMGNHGVLATGATVAEAFDRLYYFERSAETLITAFSTGKPLKELSPEVAERTAQDWESPGVAGEISRHFAALMAILDEEEPDFRR